MTNEANTNLMACPACRREIAKSALSCPYCGQPSPLKEQKRQEFEATWSKNPIVGKDIVIASRCDIRSGEINLLEFSSDTPLENDGLKHISSLNKLEILSLHSAKITDDGINYLMGLTQLKSLDLIGCSITSSGLAQLINLKELAHVSLDGEQASEMGLKNLKLLPKLERLTLSGRNVTDTTMNLLSGFPKLEYLYLEKTSVSETGLKRLKMAQPTLKILNKQTYKEM
jgi:Leucine-rich repeat (LRR) protein